MVLTCTYCNYLNHRTYIKPKIIEFPKDMQLQIQNYLFHTNKGAHVCLINDNIILKPRTNSSYKHNYIVKSSSAIQIIRPWINYILCEMCLAFFVKKRDCEKLIP